jgi:hypothetical protein
MKIRKTGFWVFDSCGWVRAWSKDEHGADLIAREIGGYTEIRAAGSVVVLRHGRDLLKLSHVRLDHKLANIVY